jgi:arsenate reductase-like glutaredoxin family protein
MNNVETPALINGPARFKMELTLYGRAGCPMCMDANAWLNKEKIAYTFRDIFKQPLTGKELLLLANKLPDGIFSLYAPKGAKKAGLSENPFDFSSEAILGLQTGNPDMIRYPIFDTGRQLIFGFKESTKPLLLSVLH